MEVTYYNYSEYGIFDTFYKKILVAQFIRKKMNCDIWSYENSYKVQPIARLKLKI